MGRWTRQELEHEFAEYQKAAGTAAETGDWTRWADKFTEDAEYVEHLYGDMHGRDEIRSWISETMSTYPGNAMTEFPIGWYVVDEDRGWVVCQVWNRMADPGDGSIHQAYNVTLLKYAGDGLWSYEEDIYNPARFASMIQAWQERQTTLQAEAPR
ncbi:MAG: nuclear transport factor 2 family protein [Acidimicrobiales bacterium]